MGRIFHQEIGYCTEMLEDTKDLHTCVVRVLNRFLQGRWPSDPLRLATLGIEDAFELFMRCLG